MRVRCSTTAERSSPATSVSHGAAQSPCRDHDMPTPVAPRGAMRQKRESRKIVEKLTFGAESADGAGFCSGTTRRMRSATAAGYHGQKGEQAAPADALDYQLGWTCCGQRAERAQHDVPAIREGDALRRKPHDDRLEAGHQTDRDPKPDQGAAEHQSPDAVGKSEHKGPGGGEEKQGAVDEPWSVAVEKHAAREHDRGKHQEIRRREQTEIGGAQTELGSGDRRR